MPGSKMLRSKSIQCYCLAFIHVGSNVKNNSLKKIGEKPMRNSGAWTISHSDSGYCLGLVREISKEIGRYGRIDWIEHCIRFTAYLWDRYVICKTSRARKWAPNWRRYSRRDRRIKIFSWNWFVIDETKILCSYSLWTYLSEAFYLFFRWKKIHMTFILSGKERISLSPK